MGNRQAKGDALRHRKEMGDLRKALEDKAVTKAVALLKAHGTANTELAKEGCQQLFYMLGREGEAKREANLEVFRKGGFPAGLVAIINNHGKASEAAGWACAIVVNLTEGARNNRKYENFALELVDAHVCEAIHDALANSTDDFLKEQCVAAKANLVKLDKGEEAFAKLK